MNTKNLLTVMLIAVSLQSCDEKRDRFPVTFSEPVLQFTKDGGDTTIISMSDEWGFGQSLSLDGVIVNYPRCEEVFLNTEPIKMAPGSCSNDILTVKYDYTTRDFEPVQIEGSWFKVTKKSSTDVDIVVTPNLSGKFRRLWIIVDSNGTLIDVTQHAD
ncbi:MAG: hypothetical protein ACK5KP_03410 [Paludibacteraceae bacterium]